MGNNILPAGNIRTGIPNTNPILTIGTRHDRTGSMKSQNLPALREKGND